MAARPPSHRSLLQLLRSLFGLPQSTWGTWEPRAEGQELGAVGGRSGPGEPSGQQHPSWEPWGGAEGESTEPLLGELEELSLAGSLGSSTSRSCLTLSTSDTELAVAGKVVDTPAGSPARQRAGSGVVSEEGTAMPEAFGDKAVGTDGLLQGLGADGEDVTCSASPKPIFSVDFDAEWEKEQLLKADEGAGSPKAELAWWNWLFNVNRHRRSSHKPPARRSPKEPGSRAEPLLNAPVRPVLPANPPGAVLAERFGPPTQRGCHGSGQARLLQTLGKTSAPTPAPRVLEHGWPWAVQCGREPRPQCQQRVHVAHGSVRLTMALLNRPEDVSKGRLLSARLASQHPALQGYGEQLQCAKEQRTPCCSSGFIRSFLLVPSGVAGSARRRTAPFPVGQGGRMQVVAVPSAWGPRSELRCTGSPQSTAAVPRPRVSPRRVYHGCLCALDEERI
ncbi:uncharacterized protein LOC129196275 [Grus americana]|uniref:uncharacterized protein LOC129196275 n=1 Tax=Grus americana TaxID=9117 RepID=UPI002407F674|nr:uncharacterized protein LOC129196275 [Grus americana]